LEIFKKYSGLLLIAAFVVAFCNACTKDKTSLAPPFDCSGIDSATNTYTFKIKRILINNCAYSPCHDAGTQKFGVNMSTYRGAVTAFQSQNAACAIQNAGCVPMPYQLPQLPDSIIKYLICWSDNGYKQ
jgi:hypothetical protein